MNLKIIITSFCFFIVSCIQLQAQYYMKIGNESTALEKDSVILVAGNYRGTINWQISSDSVHWETIASSGDTLKIRIDSNAVYRARINEGTCEPVFSDALQLTEKAIYTNENYVTADSSGGVYYLPGGIKIKIPPGAIDSTLVIYAERIDSADCYDALPPETDADRLFLGSLNLIPNDVVLKKPVKIKFPVNNYGPDNLFIFTGFDPLLYTPMKFYGYFMVSFHENFAEYVTDRLLPMRIEAVPLAGQSAQMKSTAEQSEKSDCHEGTIIVKTETSDFEKFYKPKTSAGGEQIDCTMPSDKGEITFVDCGNLKESYEVREIGSGCAPEMQLTIEKDMLRTGEPVQAKITLKIGDQLMANQKVKVVHSGSLRTALNTDFTGADGTLTFIVTADKPDNNAYIECSSQTEYFGQVIIVSSAASTNRWNNFPESKYCSVKKKLICYDECTRPEALDCSNLSTIDCERVKRLLTAQVEIEPEQMALRKGTSFTYPVRAKNYLGDYITEIPTILWSSGNPSVADVINGRVTAFGSGKALIYAEWCNSREQNEVSVEDLCDEAEYVIDNSLRKLFLKEEHRIQAYCKFKKSGSSYVPDIHWKSSNPGVADVDSGGYVKAGDFGSAEITASWCDTSVTIPVVVRSRKETWVGVFTTGYEDYCAQYSCSIVFDFTVCWDSLKPPDDPGATGRIEGTGTAFQTIKRQNACKNTDYYAVPEFDMNIEGAAWDKAGTILVKFPGYYGYWKTRKCILSITFGECLSWCTVEDEEYYDLIPSNNQTIQVKGLTGIKLDMDYKFGFNCAGGNFVPYAYDVLNRAHISMTRVWCNYE